MIAVNAFVAGFRYRYGAKKLACINWVPASFLLFGVHGFTEEKLEHRIGRRKKVNASVELWQGDCKRGDFKLFNIGPGGLFLSGKATDIDKGEIYTIKSARDDQIVINYGDLTAMVVHHSAAGIGLMWAGCDRSFISRLSNVLARVA